MGLYLRTLFGCLFTWHLKQTGNLSDGDVIITHAGGETVDSNPGKINKFLEGIVREIHKQTGSRLPIIAQGELARCISDLPLVGEIPRQAESEEYIDSLYVAKIHKEICDKNGWKRPILVSYHPHIWRGMMVARKLGMEVIVPEIPRGVYDRDCSQRWMRSPWFNTPRELACRLVWLIQGKI